MKTKYFMWYDSCGNTLWKGPHYTCDEKLIGKKYYHTLEDLLKINSISDVMKEKLKDVEVGTKIAVHYLHSNGILMLKCITFDEAKELDLFDGINHNINELKSQIEELELKKKRTISKIFHNNHKCKELIDENNFHYKDEDE